MNLTDALRRYLVDNCGVEKDASDDDYRKAAGDALASGKLSAEKLAELLADTKAKPANELASKLDAIVKSLGDFVEAQTKPKEEPKKTEPPEKEIPIDEYERSGMAKKIAGMAGGVEGEGEAEKEPKIRLKAAVERYATTKSALTDKAGKPVMNYCEDGRPMDDSSERDKAVAGAWAKWTVARSQCHGSRSLAFQMLPQHDKEVLQWALENEKWNGWTGMDANFTDFEERRLTPSERKALIDDTTSGGLEAVPIVFDDLVIQAPLLYGELYPLVNTVPLDRGRRVEGVSTGTVTGSWGGVDDTAI